MALVRDAKNPSIIHVIDERLKKIADYPLEKKLTIAFSGTIGDLAWAGLSKRLPTIGPETQVLIGDAIDDYVTKVAVDAKDEKVRAVLTDCVPLDVYGPLLWRARTETAGGKTTTSVAYYGPVDKKAVFWEKYAAAMAEKFDCYLTIEESDDFDAPPDMPARWSSLAAKYMLRGCKADTIEQFIDTLHRELEEVRILRDPENPKVIHLVDEPLLKIEGYFMDRKVDLDYSGPLGGVLDELEKKYPDFGLRTKANRVVGVTGTTVKLVDVAGDRTTSVRVSVQTQSVRDLLTRSVPLKGYHRILWRSETAKTGGKYVSSVTYSGREPPLREKPQPPAGRAADGKRKYFQNKSVFDGQAPPPTVAATTMAGRGLVEDLSNGFALAGKGGETVRRDLTTPWLPFVEFTRGRFAGLLHTAVPDVERQTIESGPAEIKTLRQVLVGEFRILCVVHPDNSLKSLDLSGIGRLLKETESPSSWKVVGGGNQKVTCYLENEKAASRELVQWKCMKWQDENGGGEYPYRKDAITCASPADVLRKVAGDRSGLGLFLYDPRDEEIGMLLKRITVLRIGCTEKGPFIEPSREPILQSDYSLSEPVVLFLHPHAPPLVSQFFDFCASPAGAKIAERDGLITPWRQQQHEGDHRLK